MSQSPSSQPIRFYHRGQIVEVQGPHPTRSVLDWLRGWLKNHPQVSVGAAVKD